MLIGKINPDLNMAEQIQQGTFKEGDFVKAGDELAGIGTTGYSTGPHLHYQVQVNGENVDGMSLIDFSDKKPPFNPGYNPGYNPGGLTPYNPNPSFPTRP